MAKVLDAAARLSGGEARAAVTFSQAVAAQEMAAKTELPASQADSGPLNVLTVQIIVRKTADNGGKTCFDTLLEKNRRGGDNRPAAR